jgi:rare lipoprotein A
VRQLALILSTLLVFWSCGGRKVQVAAPASSSSGELDGIASYYAEPYHGRRTASGEVFDTYSAMTAAHRTLPFNTVVRVKNKSNGKEVDVRINDRGPFIDGRVIDLSLRAARELDMVREGIVPVQLEIMNQGDIARPTPSDAFYAVQVGAFENESAADDLKRQLEKKYTGVTVQAVFGDRTLYRVRIGRDPSIQAAHRLAAQLRNEDLDSFVVRVN